MLQETKQNKTKQNKTKKYGKQLKAVDSTSFSSDNPLQKKKKKEKKKRNTKPRVKTKLLINVVTNASGYTNVYVRTNVCVYMHATNALNVL